MTDVLSSALPQSHRLWRYGRDAGSCRVGAFVAILAVIVSLGSASVLATEGRYIHLAPTVQSQGPGTAELTRYRVFSLRHISAEKGKKYLEELEIGTVSQLPGANMLLVTASPRELIKAASILTLVDARQEFAIRVIPQISAAPAHPSNEQIAAQVGGVSIGTFFKPPDDAPGARVIIDAHNGGLVAVAPAELLERIVYAIERRRTKPPLQTARTAEMAEPIELGRKEPWNAELTAQVQPVTLKSPRQPEKPEGPDATQQAPSAEPAREYKSTSGELFNGLLDLLADAEKKAAEKAAQAEKPKEPGAAVPVEKAEVPTRPSAVSKEQEVPPEQREKIDLTALLEKLEVGMKGPPEPEPPAEKVTVKIEEPNKLPELPKEKPAVEAEEPNEVVGPPKEQVPAKVAEPNEVAKPSEVPEPNEAVEPPSKVRYAPESIPRGEDVLTVDLPEKLPITDFLDFVGKNLKLDFLYDPAQVKGDVTLRINGELRGPIKVKELYAMMESVLQFYGFAMTRKGNLVTVRPTADAALIDPPLVRAEGDKVEAGDVVITRVFELEHIDPASAQNLLTGMKLGLTVTPISGTGTLIVTDYAYRMARVEELIKMVDKPGEPKEFRYRPLKYTMAQTLAPKIKTLVEQLGEIAITVVKPETPPQQPPGRRPSRPSRRPPPKKPTPAPKQPPAAAQPTVYLDFDERTNRILMIGLKSELDIVEELIDSLDVVQQDLRSLRLYEIQNVDAEEVRIKLGELGIITGERTDLRRTRRGADRTGVPSRTRQPARPGTQAPPARTVTGAATEEPLVEEPQVVIIETINSLLVNATPEQHAQIAMIIGYVDSVPEQKDIPYVVYPLENQDPEELANVLNQLIQETTTRQEKDAKIVTTTKTTEEDIIIIPDPKTYSLIVYASKRNQQWIRALVEQLDEYRAQVLLDVTLVEILKSDEFELDVDLISKFPKLEAGETMDFLNALLEPFPAKRIKEATSFSGVGDAFFADSHVQLLLHAVQRKGYGRILARPKLLVNDNEEGVIKDERTTTIVTVKTQVIPGTAATASVAAPSVEFQPYEEGITLTITPHISKGDQLQLTIALIRTNFEEQDDYTITVPGAGADGGGGTLSGPTPPDLLTTDVSTVVTVPDNHTIILGGLERVNQTKGGTKVPLLGDIPLIGGLFRSTRNKDDQSRLYVFVKPHIVRPGEPLDGTSRIEVVSKKSRLKFESYEDEMQKYEDWPGIKPKPMSPLRALEVD